jgi:nifR3 family TIM-barrel protein
MEIANKIVLAPMAGITDKAFRLIARDFGCGLLYTEMISAKALTYKNIKTKALLDLSGEEQPIAVQLFGSEPEVMARAAVIAAKEGAGLIDINMGCPVPKIVKNGEGSALLEKPEVAFSIVKAMKQAVSVPVTAKIRSGFSPGNIVAAEFAKGLADAGADAVCIHSRTRDQYYAGKADWSMIKKVKASVSIPVIGSGDIWTPQDAQRMLEETGCDAVMLGRGVLGNPWLIANARAFLSGGEMKFPSARDKVEGAMVHLDLMIGLKGEEIGVREMRKHIAWYLKGLPHTAAVKEGIFKAKTRREAGGLLQEYLLRYAEN